MTTLRVHCWRNEYLAPPASGAADLDRLVERVAETLADELDGLPGLDEHGVILLRELRIAFDLDPGCAPAQAVRHWSRQLAEALVDALAADEALRFPTLAAYHARFIADLLHGRAWDSWMYRCFEGLRVLPPGAVLRTLLVEDAARGRATLARLAPAAWPLLFHTLPVREAARILGHWAGAQQPDADGLPGQAASLLAWAAAGPELPDALAPPLAALWLLASWERAGIAAAPVGLASWLAALLALPPDAGAARLRRIAGRADLDALQRAPNASRDHDWLLLLASAPRAWRAAAATVAAALRSLPAAAPPATADDSIASPCAGLAWLLPALLQLLRGAASTLPLAPGAAAALDVAALSALSLAAGPRGAQSWRDPFWRAFLGLPPGLSIDQLHGWLAPHDPAPFTAALEAALRAQALRPAVRLRGPRQRGAAAEVLVERGSACPLGSASRSTNGIADTACSFGERLGLARLQRRDRAWLARSPLWTALPPPWREAFALLAAGTLRRSANRIPGMARASIPYLFANVLGVSGQATCARGNDTSGPAPAWTLETARPPLHVLLALNGMARLHLDWPGTRSLDLRSAG